MPNGINGILASHMGVGRTIGFLFGLAVLSGVAITVRSSAPDHHIPTVWTFSPAHADQLRATATGSAPVDVSLLAARALDIRLQSLQRSGEATHVPELVEIEIGSVGKYFSGSADNVPFVPLTDRLRASGWLDHISPSRLAAWSKDGQIFGLPLDVHPVSLTYRKDLLAAAGIDLMIVTTWRELHDRCLAFERVERDAGRRTRAIQLPSGSADVLSMMLQQRGVQLVDAQDKPNLIDPRVADTLIRYAQLVAGPRRVSADASPGPGRWADDLARGDVAIAMTPDWALADLRRTSVSLDGKLAMRRLPVFDPSDAPTASWGGTMVAIPRVCPDPDAAWALLEQLYLSESARQVRAKDDILPAVVDWWDNTTQPVGDPLYAGQPIRSLYATLARQLPARVVTPFTGMATSALSLVLYRTTAAIERGDADEQVIDQVHQWLAEANADLQRRIGFANLGR